MVNPKILWTYSLGIYGLIPALILGVPSPFEPWIFTVFLPVLFYGIPLVLFTKYDRQSLSKQPVLIRAFFRYRIIILALIFLAVSMTDVYFYRFSPSTTVFLLTAWNALYTILLARLMRREDQGKFSY